MSSRKITRHPLRRVIESILPGYRKSHASANSSAGSGFLRRPRVEPLEDRRMLSVTLFVDGDSSTGGDGLNWETAHTDLQAAFDHAATLNADGDAANDVDAIWMAEGTYYPTAELEEGDPRSASFSLLDGVGLFGGFAGTEVTLGERAADPTEHETVLSGDIGVAGEDADNAYTVVYCAQGVTAEMDGVTVTGGMADGKGDNEHLERCYGGGACVNGSLTLRQSWFVHNEAADSGGGIFVDGQLNAVNSRFVRNEAHHSGGAVSSRGLASFQGCLFIENTALFSDGGGVTGWGGSLTIASSTFIKNSAYFSGGAVRVKQCDAVIQDSTFRGNSAGDDGGAIYTRDNSLSLVNSTLWGNVANGGGGGLYCGSASSGFTTNCTLAENGAQEGGGIHHRGSSFVIHNSIVAENQSLDGVDINGDPDDVNCVNCLIGAIAGGADGFSPGNNNLVGTTENPIDPLLSDWTLLDDGSWGYYLLSGSPAENAGADVLAVDADGEPIDTDLYGAPRILDGSVDMGSREGVTEGISAQTYVVTSLADTIDPNDGELTFVEVFEAAQRNTVVGNAPAGSFAEQDIIGFADGLSGTVALNGQSLDVMGDLRIQGPGAGNLCFDAGGFSRAFKVEPAVNVTLEGIEIRGGRVPATNLAWTGCGAGILNHGRLEVVESFITENNAHRGAGIYNTGFLCLTHTVVAANACTNDGGGVYNSGLANATETAITSNVAAGQGGGFYNTHTVELTNCTITRNLGGHQYGPGGGFSSLSIQPSGVTINNSIIAGNMANDDATTDVWFYRYEEAVSGSNNLIGNGSEQEVFLSGVDGNLVGTSDHPIDPLLSDLTRLEDGLWSVFPLPGSPALDAGDNSLAVDAGGTPLAVDLAGNARIQNGTVDIGCTEGAVNVAAGKIYLVDSLADIVDPNDGQLTFREAFTAACWNQPVGDAPAGSFGERDEIRFADSVSGVISTQGTPLAVSGDLSIIGPGAGRLVMDGLNQSRVLEVVPGGDLRLEGITVTSGGAVNFGAMTVDACVFSNNTAEDGGAIDNYGALNIADSDLVGNTASGSGGAIQNSGSLTVFCTTLSNNTTLYSGGAIYNQGEAKVRNCTLAANVAGLLSDETSSSGYGGAIANSGTMEMVCSAIHGNIARYGGGGISNLELLVVQNSTIAANTAEYGAGLRSRGTSSDLTVQSTIIACNRATDPTGFNDISFDVREPFAITHNLIGDGTGQTVLVDGQDGNLVGTAENPLDPKFLRAPSPGHDEIWGTEDDDYGDLQIAADSPARDAGDKSLLPADEFDLDGDGDTTEPLPLDILGNPRVDNGRVDMGAYEYQSGNLVPLVIDDTYFTDEDIPLVVDGIDLPTVFENDADPEGLPLTAVWASNPAHGILELNVDGTFTYEPDADWHGADWFTYVAYDGTGYSDPAMVFVIVRAVNDPPVLEPIGDFVLDEQTLLSFTAEASDSNDLFPSPVTFSATGLPDGATLDPETGAFSWTPDEAQDGVYSITVIAADADDPAVFASETITVTVNEVNRPPYFEIEGSCAVAFGVPWSMRVQVLDPDLPANGITLDVEGLPDDVAYDVATGILSWTAGVEDVGDYAVTFQAEDDGEPSYRVAHHLTLSVRKGPMLHVDADAEAGGDGLTWATAFQDIQSALDAAGTINADAVPANDISQIWIAEGTYLPTAELELGTVRSAAFSLIDGVTLCGGFVGTETTFAERGGGPMEHQTILSGDLGVVGDDADNAATVVYCGEGIEAGLDGLTITGGNADLDWSSSRPERRSGGGIYNNGAIEMANCRVQENRAYNHGGGSYITGEFSVTDSSFLANETNVSGAGVYNAGYARFVGTLFHGNSSGVNSWGGAIRSDYGTLEIVSSSFLANAAARGGGIAQVGGDMTVMNGRFVANTAGEKGGGVYIAQHEGTTSIANSTFTANTATDEGGGLCADDSRRPRVVNSIVAGNDAAYAPDFRAILAADSGRNLIGTDPFFTRNPSPGTDGEWGTEDDDFGDLRLTASSPAIDFGLDDVLPEGIVEDLAGSPRVYGEHVDLGAYEHQAAPAEGRDTPSNVVTTNEDVLDFHDGMTSLREVVFYAEAGDPAFSTVRFDESLNGATIALDGSALTLTRSIHIDASALDSLTIDAGGLSRAFVVAGETTEVTLENLNITGGYAGRGGAIRSTDATLVLVECLLSGNEATVRGSAVYASSGSLLFEGSILTDNAGPFAVHAAEVELTVRETLMANGAGGLRVTGSGTAHVEDSTFTGNTDSAIRVEDGEVVVFNCRFEDNEAATGAAVYVESGSVELNGAAFSHNAASENGGAVYNSSGTLSVVDSLFHDNSAYNGAAICNKSGTSTVVNTFFLANNTERDGTVANYRHLVVTNCTFVDNMALYGAGIHSGSSASTITVDNSIFARNGKAGQRFNFSAGGGTISGSNNLIDDGSYGTRFFTDGVDGNLVGTAENPIDPLLSNFTQFDNGRWGYYLLSGSPALNAGNNDLAVDDAGEPLTADAAGRRRIVDEIVDIGAVEGVPDPVPAQTYVVTSLENVIDPDDGELTFVEAFEAAGRNQPVGDAPAGSLPEPDVIRFTEGLTGTLSLDGEALRVLGDLRIEGPGADLMTFDAEHRSRVFEIESSVSVVLAGLTITGGFSEENGGGIFNQGKLTVRDCVVRSNETAGSGGGIYARDDMGIAELAVENSIVVGNIADSLGGGVYSSAKLRIVSSTIAGNASASQGGGLRFVGTEDKNGIVINTIIAGNTSGSEPDLYAPEDFLTGSHNLIGNGSGQTALIDGTDGNLVGTAELPIDPLFLRNPSPGQDGSWGTLDDDFGVLRVRGDSPAVDAGDASLLPADAYDADGDGDIEEPIPFDLAGNTRVYNEALDIGAYETHPGVIVSGSLAGEPNIGQVVLTFTVSIYPAQTADFTAEYTTSDLSAVAGADYTAVTGTITIPAGEIAGTIDVPVLGDWDAEGDEAFLLHLTGEFEGNPFEHEATGTIVEDDGRDYIVDSLDDTIAEDGVLTLREALEAANTNTAVGDAPAGHAGPRVDYIHFDPTLFADGPATILLDGTAFTIADDTLVLGPGADLLTLDAQSQSRVFEIGPSASATIVGLGVTGGYGDENGGGIYNEGTLTLLNCRVSGNEAAQYGGGVYSAWAETEPELTLIGCEVARNTARSGAGLYNASRLTVTNCTIARNWADVGGGGMTTSGNGSVATIHNTIIAGNRASSDWNGVDISVGTGTLDGSHNVIGVTSRQEAFVHGIDGNFVGTYESPFDPRFLQDPIGPDGAWHTADDVVGDLRLQFDSPAIDAGDAARLPADAYDLDADGDIGETLSQDPARGDRIAGDGVDIGAYETQPGWHIVPARITEGDDGTSLIRFTVSLYPAQETDVTVDFATVDGSAVAGADYESSSGTLTVPAGENIATVDVPVVGNRVPEADKTFLLRLSSSSGPEIVIPEAAGTIVDNDGNTYVVDSLEDVVAADGVLTLREALLAANSNFAVGDAPAGISGPRTDHIVFDPALFADGPVSIVLSGGVLTIADAVTIVGPGAELLAVDGAGRGRIFAVEQDGTARIAGITITGGNEAEDMGGAILNKGVLTVADAVIRDNYAKNGGGIMNYAYEAQASLTLVDCSLLRNSAELGGAIYSYGGGFSEDGSAFLTITSSEILGNTAEHGGGIFSSAYSSVSDGTSEVSIANSVLIGNAAASASGAISTYCSSDGISTTRIANSTIAGNVAGSEGGAISRYYYPGDTTDMEIVGSIIALNSAPSIANMGELIEGGSRANLIGGDPLFVRNPSPGADQIWGTEDDDYGDVTPSPESPAIDTGWNAAVPEDVETDVLGNPRFFGDRVDVGAVEAQTAPAPGREAPSAVVTTDSDVVDSYDGFISLREALFYVGTQQTQTPSITFAPSLDGATIALSGSPLEVCSSVTIDASALDSLTVDAGRRSRVFIVRGENEVVFDSLTITGGFDSDKGGGIYNSATLAVLNSTLVRNEADYYGGGVYNVGVLHVVNSSLLGNCSGSGGAVYNEAPAELENVLIAGNTASSGGGIYNNGSLVLSNVSVGGNSASYRAGGVYNVYTSHFETGGTLTLNNTVIAENTAETSPDLYGQVLSGSYNLIGTCSIDAGTGNLSGTEESPLDPRFLRNPDPGPDGEWGTWDDDYGYLALRSDSPALGAGNIDLIPADTFDLDGDSDTDEPVPYDARGNPRITEGTVSMGAVEPVAGIFVGDATQLEGNEGTAPLRFVVSIYPAPENDFTIDYATSDLTATAGVDYTATSGTLTIAAGASEGVIEVAVLADVVMEGKETFLLTLSHAGGPEAVDAEVVGTIVDDDGRTIVVDSLEDVVAEDGVVTLREAIEAANENRPVGDAPAGCGYPQRDVIAFAPELFNADGASIELENGEFFIRGDVAIAGPGAGLLTIDAMERSRVFQIEANADASISGLTVTGGFSTASGGGLFNYGRVSLSDVVFEENVASSSGGAIYNTGTCAIVTATFHGNAAMAAYSSNYPYGGGGIYSYGSLYAANVTFGKNDASATGGAVLARGTLTLVNCTLADNSAGHVGGGLNFSDSRGTLTLVNNIIADNAAETGPDLSYTYRSAVKVNNLVSDNSATGFTDGENGNIVGTAAGRVHPLLTEWSWFDNGQGGYYLRSGSLAIGAGDPARAVDAEGNPLATDQAGGPRFDGDAVNMGATQFAAAVPPATVYLATSFDTNIAADGVLTFWEALEAATSNTAVGDAPAGSWGERDIIRFDGSVLESYVLDGTPIELSGFLGIESDGEHPFVFNADGQSRVFECADGCDVLLKGLTLTGGLADDGGAIYNRTGILALEAVVLHDNESTLHGGAIYNESGTVQITESTCVANVADSHGGAIYSAAGRVLVERSEFENNTASFGGAVYNGAGALSTNDSVFNANTAGTSGGAVYNDTGTAAVCETRFEENSTVNETDGSGGGAAFNASGTFEIIDSEFFRNAASATPSYSGGGAVFNDSGDIRIEGSEFSENAAQNTDGLSRGGGAVYENGGTVTIVASQFRRNSATQYASLQAGGGALYAYKGLMDLLECLFVGNSAPYGGAVFLEAACVDLLHCVLVGNSAQHGGGIYTFGKTSSCKLFVTNSTVVANSADDGGGVYQCYANGQTHLYSTIIALNEAPSGPDFGEVQAGGWGNRRNNLISDGSSQSTLTNGTDGNLVGTAENPIDPRFVRNPSPGPDEIWGTEDDDCGDLRLQAESPAVNAGRNSSLPRDTADLDGDGDMQETIPYDYLHNPRISEEIVDIGACEYTPVVLLPGDLNADGAVNSDDLDIVRANWGLSVAAGSLIDGDPTGDGVVNSDDLNVIRANWGTHAPAAAAAATEKCPASSATGDGSEAEAVGRSDSALKTHAAGCDAAMRNWDTPRAAWLEAVKALETGPDTPARTAKVRRAVDLILEGLV